ncbi:MAG: nuclear transport factor 2 family protein [Myxococcales bacterium]|nr:nuclear transport factor 2 family protein [Myxococcales bacterium]
MDPYQTYQLALQSPALVGAKDREGWVDLFHPDGFVEDPVEAGRYRGRPSIETFWDVFIGPQPSVAFDVRRDYWGGDTLIRQATVVNITQADPVRPLKVPALIRYTLREGRVGSLRAIWEPRHVVGWFVGLGPKGIWALSRHGVRMMAKAGLHNGLSFGGTLVGGLGRPAAQAMVEALRSGEASRWAALGPARVTVAHEDEQHEFEDQPGKALEQLRTWADPLPELVLDQLLVCGHHVGAFLVHPERPGGLALMMQALRPDRIASLTAIWSSEPRVLDLSPAGTPTGTPTGIK